MTHDVAVEHRRFQCWLVWAWPTGDDPYFISAAGVDDFASHLEVAICNRVERSTQHGDAGGFADYCGEDSGLGGLKNAKEKRREKVNLVTCTK